MSAVVSPFDLKFQTCSLTVVLHAFPVLLHINNRMSEYETICHHLRQNKPLYTAHTGTNMAHGTKGKIKLNQMSYIKYKALSLTSTSFTMSSGIIFCKPNVTIIPLYTSKQLEPVAMSENILIHHLYTESCESSLVFKTSYIHQSL